MRIHRDDLYQFFLQPLDKGTNLERGLKLTTSIIVGILTLGITHAIIGGLHQRQVKKLELQQGIPTTIKTAQIRANSLSMLDFATSLSALEEEFNVSPITPENFLMNDPEEFHVGNALAGFRAETVPETDLTQGLGPHTDDMTSYRTYEDGTCSLIVTDGEGGSPASDSYSHYINLHLHEILALARPEFNRLLIEGDLEGTQILAEKALKLAYNQGRKDHAAYIMQKTGCDIDDDDELLYAGATTVAAAMTLKDPADPLNVWVIGVNVYDSPIVIMTPVSTEVYETHANCNLGSEEPSYNTYLQNSPPDAAPQFFVIKRPANSLLLAMSDGVTDNLPRIIAGKDNPEGANEEIGLGIQSVIRNPYFDVIPDIPASCTLTLKELQSLGNPDQSTLFNELTPKMISKRIKNFVFWRTAAARRHLEHFDPISPLFVYERLRKRKGEYDRFSYQQIIWAAVPQEKWEQFTANMEKLELDLSAVPSRPMDKDSKEVYNASHNKTIVMENSIPYVMIDWGALDQFYYQHFKQELDKLGGKTDGASLIAGFAKS